jgi:hypothetical protein
MYTNTTTPSSCGPTDSTSTTRATATTRPGHTSSTSTTLCAATTHRHDIVFRLYINNADLPLDFSSVGCTGSRRASGHCVSRRDYSSFELHRLYCAYVVHPDASSRRSTTRRSNCTGSSAPIHASGRAVLPLDFSSVGTHWLSSCVRSLRLTARLLVVRIALALLRLCHAS